MLGVGKGPTIKETVYVRKQTECNLACSCRTGTTRTQLISAAGAIGSTLRFSEEAISSRRELASPVGPGVGRRVTEPSNSNAGGNGATRIAQEKSPVIRKIFYLHRNIAPRAGVARESQLVILDVIQHSPRHRQRPHTPRNVFLGSAEPVLHSGRQPGPSGGFACLGRVNGTLGLLRIWGASAQAQHCLRHNQAHPRPATPQNVFFNVHKLEYIAKRVQHCFMFTLC